MDVVTISNQELESVFELMSVTGRNLDEPSGWVLLHVRDGRRIWTATDTKITIELATELDDREYSILLTAAQTYGAYHAVDINGSVEIFAEEKDGQMITHVRADLFEVTAVQPDREHPLVSYRFDGIDVGAKADFVATELRAVAHTARVSVDNSSDTDRIVPVMLDRGKLQFFGKHEESGAYVSSYRLGREGTVYLLVDVCHFTQAANYFQPWETVKLVFPNLEGDPIVFVGEKFSVALMPELTARRRASDHVFKVIFDTIGNLASCLNDDGEHLLRRHGHQVRGKFIRDEKENYRFRVFGTLLEDVVGSQELFEEINQVNYASDFAKVVLVDCRVVVYYDLLAETLDGPELITAIEAVAKTIEKYADTFSVVFGGDTGVAPEEVRWREALGTIVDCEISPGKEVTLNGGGAIEEWPFPSTVHVLSGYNPQGIEYDGSDVNPKIARDVLDMGGRCAVGAERDSSHSVSDPAVIAWGLTREQAREIGRRAGQDLIIELTADQLTLVQCCGVREEAIPRR